MQPERASTSHVILCFNSGSSSVKFALYRLGEVEEVQLAHGAVERIGLAGGHLWIRGMDNAALVDVHRDFPAHAAAAEGIFVAAKDLGLPPPVAVGHRVVHGGPDHTAPERVDAPLLATLRRLVAFAPLHLPSAIQGLEAVAARFPGLPQVACFDTAFHRRMPEVAQRFPLSRDLWHDGIRRYGFHGLSYEYIVATLGAAARGRLAIAHLGNGASLAAVHHGQPLDTTMGFTPTGGVMMGTRSGDLDPGVLLHLMHARGYDVRQVEHLVNQAARAAGGVRHQPRHADLAGAAGARAARGPGDRAVLLPAPQAHQGADGGARWPRPLVFTGGIGEHAAPVRWEVCRGLAYLGIDLGPQRNAVHADVISTLGSACMVRVIPTNEDLIIARHTRTLLVSTAAP